MPKKLCFLLLTLFFMGCSKDQFSPPPPPSDFDDFLGVGANPTPPAIQESNFTLVDKATLSSAFSNKLRSTPSPTNSSPSSQISDPVGIFSATGALLTLWSLKETAWVWGYTPFDSLSFGNARDWRVITFENGEVSFKNEASGFCLAGYGNGVIHVRCNPQDKAQRWSLIFFKNQAVQVKNVGKGKCMQTPEIRQRVWYSIFLVDCIDAGKENLDQQWYIIAPAKRTTPVFTFN